MAKAWTLGGLPVGELLRRTAVESWTDAIYGQAGRMAFYHFLAIFPCLLIFLAFAGGVPSIGTGVKHAAQGVVEDVLPGPVAGLVQKMEVELQAEAPSGFEFLSTCVGALWAAMNGTWALVFGLNIAYEVKEDRRWWKLGLTIFGLTVTLGILTAIALVVLFAATRIGNQIFHGMSLMMLRAGEWLVVLMLLMLSFAIIYRFAPNLKDARWKWSTPGSLCALVLWVASTVGLRFYFEHITDYRHMYGQLNTVVMLMLWLYLTNAAIVIGGEMNSEIEKAARKTGEDRSKTQQMAARGPA